MVSSTIHLQSRFDLSSAELNHPKTRILSINQKQSINLPIRKNEKKKHINMIFAVSPINFFRHLFLLMAKSTFPVYSTNAHPYQFAVNRGLCVSNLILWIWSRNHEFEW